jgi:beta-xylosidase
MYYAAQHAVYRKHHCVGAATSANVEGPYTPLQQPLVCPSPTTIGGAIDPDGFKDADGKRYLVYKIDGNSLNSAPSVLSRRGESGGHVVLPSTSIDNYWYPTPIMVQEVGPDGLTLIGSPTKAIDHGPGEGPVVEAPSLARYVDPDSKSPTYVLFYSSNVYTTSAYNVKYATSTTGVLGPYTKADNPLLVTGDADGELIGPGGLDVDADSQRVVFHSATGLAAVTSLVRQLWTGQVYVNGTLVMI